jgi:uncharacterized membrane protein
MKEARKLKIRAEIKAQARTNFATKYWPVVGIGLLGEIIIAAMGYIPAVGWLLSLLVGTVITVGLSAFQLNVYRREELKVETLFGPFNRYGRVLGGMLWMYLFIFLWLLIFIIPVIVIIVVGVVTAIISSGALAVTGASLDLGVNGMNSMMYTFGDSPAWAGMIPYYNNFAYMQNYVNYFNPLWLLLLLLLAPVIIKSYSYFLTPYILADSPNVYATDALKLSQKMMQGYKWKLFVAQLTFLGWFLLCALTFGILWIFYVGPYYNATMAGFYQEIKEEAKRKEIEGTQALR